MAGKTIYVGNLPGDVRRSEVEDLFQKCGPCVLADTCLSLYILLFSRPLSCIDPSAFAVQCPPLSRRPRIGRTCRQVPPCSVAEFLPSLLFALSHRYGKIREIDLKLPPRPPGFAFIEFDSSRDAEDAVKGRDGYDFDGNRLRVRILVVLFVTVPSNACL